VRDATKSVLFLDVDGPLIPGRARRLHQRGSGSLNTWDPCAVAVIAALLQETNSRIVVSSQGRILGMRRFKEQMEQNGMPWLLHEDWAISTDKKMVRSEQIREWLSRHPEVTAYAVLDDENMPEFGSRMIKVTYNDGFLYEHEALLNIALHTHDKQ
jgi:hypothetical protein